MYFFQKSMLHGLAVKYMGSSLTAWAWLLVQPLSSQETLGKLRNLNTSTMSLIPYGLLWGFNELKDVKIYEQCLAQSKEVWVMMMMMTVGRFVLVGSCYPAPNESCQIS